MMTDLLAKVLEGIKAMTDEQLLAQMLDSKPYEGEMELLQAELDRREREASK